MDFSEVIVYDRALDDSERKQIEVYLSNKYLNDETSLTSDGPYTEIFQTDLVGAMQNKNASAFVRTEFDVTDPTGQELLTLRIRYDDGFIAHLNGTEIARRNAPTDPVWNSQAVVDQPDEQ